MIDDDEVDFLIDGWSAVLPQVDFSPLDIVSRMRRLSPRLQLVRRRSFARLGLTPFEFELMSALRQRGDTNSTPSELGAELGLSSGTLAGRLDRLAARGFLVRGRNPVDGRSKIVTLTPLGERRVDEAMLELLRAEREVLSGLEPAQIAVLVESLRVIATKLDRLDP